MGNHALLSASSSHRWLNCPPSARLGENYEDRGSDFAAEGTDAHSLCEHKLKTVLGIPSEDPTENLTWYNEEMEECASGYAAYVLELLAEAKKVTTDPIVLIEQRLDSHLPGLWHTGGARFHRRKTGGAGADHRLHSPLPPAGITL